MKKHRELEGLGFNIGKNVYLDIRGGVPPIPTRREIVVKAKIIDVNEFNVEKNTITIEIPLKNIAGLRFSRSHKRRGRKIVSSSFKETLERLKSFNVIEDPEGAVEKLNDGDKIILNRLRDPNKEELRVAQQIIGPGLTKRVINKVLKEIKK
jgi:hypothetical protein